MSNTYFQFKQFTIHQDHCAMKVCTDACLFGAWVGAKVKTHLSRAGTKVKNALDIGAGTGLLSLMIAQECDIMIDAVELDENAAEQAADNFELSPWKERLQVLQGDIRKIHLGRKYELVISNPPFFENALKSPDGKRNLALHSEMLGLEELIDVVQEHLADDALFAVLLPFDRKDACIALATTQGLHLAEETAVKQSNTHSFFRAMLLFATVPSDISRTSMNIREDDGYSEAFTSLLKPYYLKL
jgi:tRNA1Val (adenine37-N6)-methyltransferase